MSRTLDVYLHEALAGTQKQSTEGILTFTYGLNYLQAAEGQPSLSACHFLSSPMRLQLPVRFSLDFWQKNARAADWLQRSAFPNTALLGY